jgi:4a-hydroxytetrahydrobiopterin dehydratase
MSAIEGLAAKHCTPREGGAPLSVEEIERLLGELEGWTYGGGVITRTFRFPDYAQTMAFVNAVAWISQREDHHPDLLVRYGSCRVEYCTHAVRGLSENDFICAAKVDALSRI